MLKLRFDRRTHAIKVLVPLLAIVIIMGASYSIRAHDDRPETTPVPTAASVDSGTAGGGAASAGTLSPLGQAETRRCPHA